ncbi:MAG: hypothetical protein JSV12_02970 [Candidatus Bathyarchaeota archaeon]|nr:MAG: hypothetical protein JSV12_02970 [Candidatus Bathyarchaeota archaeon]
MARTLKKNVDVNGEKLLFQLFFLKDDEDQSVEIEEVEKVDFEKVTQRVKRGDSVFITSKRKEKMETSLVARGDTEESWYFDHIQGR